MSRTSGSGLPPHAAAQAAGPTPAGVDRVRDVILDTGFVVALYAANDRYHAAAARWLASVGGRLHSVDAVLTETAHFLPAQTRGALAGLAAEGAIVVHALDRSAYRRIAELARRYADQQPDWADLALVWLAESTGLHRIATLDAADFGIYRINGRRAFDIVWPSGPA